MRKKILCLLMAATLTVLCVGCGGEAEEEAPPQDTQTEEPSTPESSSDDLTPTGEVAKSVSIGTHATGTGFHSIGSGVASVVSSYSDTQMIVRPASGPGAWMPMLAEGQMDFGLANALECQWALEGSTEAGYEKTPNLRLVCQGNRMTVTGMVVREDSSIYNSEDLKGKRVATSYGGNYAGVVYTEAYFATVGLTWDDVVAVPVSSTTDALTKLQDGEVDAVYGLSTTTPAAVEVANAVGLRLLPWGDWDPADFENFPQDKRDAAKAMISGWDLCTYEAGEGYLTEDSIGAYYNNMLVCRAELSEATVYGVLKAIYEHTDELGEIYSQLKLWTPDIMFTEEPAAPYHDGAVKFFKEVGLWTETAEANQQALLAQAG